MRLNLAIIDDNTISCDFSGFKLHDTSAIDSAIDLFGDFLTRPDSYMDSIGVRARRAVETEDHPGFKIFALPFVGVEIGVKGNVSGLHHQGPLVGEAFVQVENLKRLVPEVDLKKVKVHVKFESFVGSSAASLNYQLEASDGHGTEEGAVKIARELRKDGTWEVTINTENPLALTQHSTLISKVISNLNVRFLGDYKMKTAQGHYSNPTIGHDFRIKFVQSKFNASSTNKEVAFEVEVENNGEMYTGEVAANLTPGRPHKVLVKINKGKKTLLQMQLKIEQAGWTDFNVQGKFILAGVEQGKGYVSFKDNMFKVEVGSHQVRIEINGLEMGSSTPKSVTITLENEGKVLWSFKTILECKSTETTFHKILTADVSGPKKENLAGTIRAEIFVNEAKEFKIKLDVVEDKRIFVDFIADTTTSPYRLSFAGPHLFKELGLPQKEYTLTVNHQKGSSLVIDVNILGDLHFDFKRAANTEGGSSVGILATQAGVELFKYQGETTKVDNEEMLKIGFEGSFDFGQDVTSFKHSLADASFVKRVDANRKVNFGLTWFKKEKNVVLNKFHIDAKVEQDGFPVFDLVIATDKKPFRFFVLSSPVHHLAECMRLTPFLFPCNPPLHDVMYKVDLEAEHDAGKSLEVVVKHPQGFKGFKLTRDGDEAEVEWDGKRLGKGEFSLTERRFQVLFIHFHPSLLGFIHFHPFHPGE